MEGLVVFGNIYKNKKVLITGNTGFKGSWLTVWLLRLDANIVGISKDIPTNPSIFEELKLQEKIKNHFEDIRNIEVIKKIIADEKPDFIFHLAAQPIVSLSYSNPVETITTNAIGTMNILESLRILELECKVIMITSDKAYDNIEQVWGYKEDDKLGGKDIYSGSKGAAELIIKSYFNSYFKNKNSKIKLGICRAGNVIGGGDWAKDRIVADCMLAWSNNVQVEIRNPNATRPWQHVLEPLSGYLTLGQNLCDNDLLNGEAFNFGPNADQEQTVKELLEDLSMYWNFKNPLDSYKIIENICFNEAKLLKLNCDKALFYLKWHPVLNYDVTVKLTSEWYFEFYKNKQNIYNKTHEQLERYVKIAEQKELIWTK